MPRLSLKDNNFESHIALEYSGKLRENRASGFKNILRFMSLDKEHRLKRCVPMGKKTAAITFERQLTISERTALRAGLWPQSQDERWIAYFSATELSIYRSWTGHCIFKLHYRDNPEGGTLGPIFVNTDVTQYRRTSDQEDIDLVYAVINMACTAADNQTAHSDAEPTR